MASHDADTTGYSIWTLAALPGRTAARVGEPPMSGWQADPARDGAAQSGDLGGDYCGGRWKCSFPVSAEHGAVRYGYRRRSAWWSVVGCAARHAIWRYSADS